jgi:hypothetical protein
MSTSQSYPLTLRAIGLTALPLTPPYVVFWDLPTAGQATPFMFNPIKPDRVVKSREVDMYKESKVELPVLLTVIG